jgi:hypothetical protein
MGGILGYTGTMLWLDGENMVKCLKQALPVK